MGFKCENLLNFLKIKERPVTVTNTAVALGSTYAAVYRAVYNDKIKAVNFEHRDGVRHITLNAELKNKEPELSNETIQDVMSSDDSEYGLHVHQIAQKAHATKTEVKAFIKEEVGLGNIEVNPTQGKHGHRYRWAGPINSSITEEMLVIAKEVEAESIAGVQLEPTADELEELPNTVTAQSKSVPIEPKQATNEPNLFANKPKDMTNAENNAATPEPQPNAPIISTPPVSPKIGYMITAAKGKIERRKNHEAARKLTEQWKKGGHKNVVIHSTLEMERPRLEVRFE